MKCVLAKSRLILDEMCRLWDASYVKCVLLNKTHFTLDASHKRHISSKILL